MKTRFSRQITSLNRRFIIWHYDIRVTVVGYNSQIERHGREECVQTYHRVGGPSESVYYLERTWHQGRLQGLEIVREINTVWYDNDYQRSNQTRSELSLHPYDGLAAVDSIRNCIQPAANDSLPDNCDFLGRIVFQHQWTSGSIEDSQQLIRNISSDDLDNLYSYLHEFDLTTVKSL